MSALAESRPVQVSPAECETFLFGIFERMLRVPKINRDDNFFDLGGDSLLAVNLFLEIEHRTGVNLPITAIYDAPTIRELACLIADETAPDFSSLVLLKPGKGKNALFIIHGIGGTVMELAALGRRMLIPEPVYAIQAKGLDGRDVPLTSIEVMADQYIDSIRAIQPSGPYWLCGYSFGGLVAMEIARRLKAANQSIGALILMDSYAHPSTWPLLSRAKMRVRRGLHLFWRLRHPSSAKIFWQAVQRIACGDNAGRLHDWLLDHNPGLPLPLLRTREAGGAALAAYRPKPYAGAITFLKATQRDTEFPDDPERIWKRLAPQMAFRTIPGGHRTIVTEYPDAAAAALSEYLSASRPHSLRTADALFEIAGAQAMQSQPV